MNYFFNIEVKYMNESYSASALGQQGEWSRGLNIALENLLNKLVIKGIEAHYIPVAYEPNKENASITPGPSTPGSTSLGKTIRPPSTKARKKQHDT